MMPTQSRRLPAFGRHVRDQLNAGMSRLDFPDRFDD
jgi:hypothetical protein